MCKCGRRKVVNRAGGGTNATHSLCPFTLLQSFVPHHFFCVLPLFFTFLCRNEFACRIFFDVLIRSCSLSPSFWVFLSSLFLCSSAQRPRVFCVHTTQQSHTRARKCVFLRCAFCSDTRARYSPRAAAWWKEKAAAVVVVCFHFLFILNLKEKKEKTHPYGGCKRGSKKGKQPEIEESEIRLKLILKKEKESEYARRALHTVDGKQKKWGFKQKGEKETAVQDKKKVEREW